MATVHEWVFEGDKCRLVNGGSFSGQNAIGSIRRLQVAICHDSALFRYRLRPEELRIYVEVYAVDGDYGDSKIIKVYVHYLLHEWGNYEKLGRSLNQHHLSNRPRP